MRTGSRQGRDASVEPASPSPLTQDQYSPSRPEHDHQTLTREGSMGGSIATSGGEAERLGDGLSFHVQSHNRSIPLNPAPVAVPSKLRMAYTPTTLIAADEKSPQHQQQQFRSGYESDGSVVVQQDGREVHLGGIGLLPEEVYDRGLHPFAAALRRLVLKNLQWESEVLARMQRRVRTPFLDAYFVNTSSLGTHTFFMTLLPAFCFFGYHDITRGLIFVLAFGVYLSSFMKDMVCSPRPYAPPVTRLTIGNHHLEYGFPSTHSTNSVSIALFFFTVISRLANTPVTPPSSEPISLIQNTTAYVADAIIEPTQMLVSPTQYWIAVAVLGFYMFSIVYGRMYTAMHSLTDCAVGVVLGVGIWTLFVLFGEALDNWVKYSGWIVPATVIPICLLCVHRHPEPVDDCPCFEDAIAFMSVVMGEFLTRWFMSHHGFDERFFKSTMAGKPFGGGVGEMWTWWSVAVAKLVVGIAAIFAWRIFAKFLLHRILPPVYRTLSLLVTLPNRRFYTPATDYKGVPPEKHLRAIPSVLDLPSLVELEVDGARVRSTVVSRGVGVGGGGDVKLRRGRAGWGEKEKREREKERVGMGIEKVYGARRESEVEEEEMGGKAEVDVVKHYDADVLTKVFVYTGIGILATGVVPIFFELIGWGMRIH